MKIIKLFLLLNFGLWAEVSPKTPRCIEYETIKNILIQGWENTDQNLTKWVIKDGEKFLEDFKKVVNIPLRALTNEEYLQKKMDSYQETKKFLESLNNKIRSKEDYKKRYELEIKYNVNYDNYTGSVNNELYRYTLVMIKYFESQKKYERSSELYKSLLKRLIDDIEIHGFNFLQLTIWEFKEEEVFLSLKHSLSSETYTLKQKSELHKLLSQILHINKNAFYQMMHMEKELVFNLMHIEYIENQAFDMYMKYDYSASIKKAIKLVDNKMLKLYFEDKALMNNLIDTYMKKYTVIYQNVLNMESKEAYENYVKNMPSYEDYLSVLDMGRLFVLLGLNNIGATSFSKVFQYEFTEDEFVKVISQFFITSGKPWIFGKYKFEWEEIAKQNEELLDLSKQ